MPWVRLDDGFGEHPKIIKAGSLAGWLYVMGLGYCNRNLTDGFIPIGMVTRLTDLDDACRLAERLVDAGLWEATGGGYRVHDYLDYQPSREQAEELSGIRADVGRRGGRASAEARAKQVASRLVEANAKQTPSKIQPRTHPDPNPDPNPEPEVVPDGTNARTREASARYSAPFEAFWRAYPRRENKSGAWSAWQKIALPRGPTGELADAILASITTWQQSEQWQRGIYPHAQTWLNRRQWEDEPAVASAGRAPPNGAAERTDQAEAGAVTWMRRHGIQAAPS
jgi:hypothetical protein